MAKIYKGENENMKRLAFYFVLQIVFGVLPAVLLAVFVTFSLYESNTVIGYIFIGIMVACAGLNIYITERYNVLLSGFRGERSLLKIVKRLKGNFTIFVNFPVRYKKNRSEIDLLLLSENYVMIIEVKNHSGQISGKHKDEYWIQRKSYHDGKVTESNMSNPLKQMRRQRDILKSILRANNHDIWIETLLFFSSPIVRLRLDLNDNDNVCSNEKELFNFLLNFKPTKPIKPEIISELNSLFLSILNK